MTNGESADFLTKSTDDGWVLGITLPKTKYRIIENNDAWEIWVQDDGTFS